MNWLDVLGGAVGAGVIAVLKILYDIYLNRNKPKIDNAEAASKLVAGGAQAVETATRLLNEVEERYEKQRKEIKAFEAWKRERERLGRVRDAELAETQQKYADLEAAYIGMTNKYNDDLKETQQLREQVQKARNDYANAQKDNIRLHELTTGLAEVLEKIKKSIQEANIPLKLNGELEHLLESVYRLKAEREGRGKE